MSDKPSIYEDPNAVTANLVGELLSGNAYWSEQQADLDPQNSARHLAAAEIMHRLYDEIAAYDIDSPALLRLDRALGMPFDSGLLAEWLEKYHDAIGDIAPSAEGYINAVAEAYGHATVADRQRSEAQQMTETVNWLVEAAGHNLALLYEENFVFSDKRVFALVQQLLKSASAVALVAWLPNYDPSRCGVCGNQGHSHSNVGFKTIERPAKRPDDDVKVSLFNLAGQLARSAAPAGAFIAGSSLELTYTVIKRPASWRDTETEVVVMPCRDVDQLRRVAIEYGDAGTMLQ
jgi:hypothetical protein